MELSHCQDIIHIYTPQQFCFLLVPESHQALEFDMSDIPYGERHVLDVFEQKAAQKPEQVFISIPNSTTDPGAGWRDVTYTLAANAVNRTAHYLLKVMGRKSTSFETIVYIGPNE